MSFVKHEQFQVYYYLTSLCTLYNAPFVFIYSKRKLFKLIYKLKNYTLLNTVFVFILVMVPSTGKDSWKAKINVYFHHEVIPHSM